MPLFKGKPAPDRSTQEVDSAAPRLCGKDEIGAMLAWQVERATSVGSSFCVLYIAPQALSGERIHAAETGIVSGAIMDQLRDDDRAGAVADDAFLVVLPNTGHDEAQVVAHRLATECTVRSSHVNRRNWRVGVAVFPDDGMSPATLTDAAVACARRTRAA